MMKDEKRRELVMAFVQRSNQFLRSKNRADRIKG